MNTSLQCPPSWSLDAGRAVASASTPLTLSPLKTRQQAMWACGDYGVIGGTLQIVGESLCEAADLAAGSRVLDVASGTGNAALAAARRYGHVTAVDYVPELLARAQERAGAERLELELVVGDAEALPFADASFDTVLSTYGVMFAPDQESAARELLRVTKRGGVIALANWTPEGFIGKLLRVVGRHVPPPAGVRLPSLWGDRTRLRELFPDVPELSATSRTFVFRYHSADHFIDVFRRLYGPTVKAFAALSEDGQAALVRDLHELIATHARAVGPAIAIESEYLEVVVRRSP